MVERLADRSSRTKSFSLPVTRGRSNAQSRPIAGPTFPRQRCLPVTGRLSPRRHATVAGRSRWEIRSPTIGSIRRCSPSRPWSWFPLRATPAAKSGSPGGRTVTSMSSSEGSTTNGTINTRCLAVIRSIACSYQPTMMGRPWFRSAKRIFYGNRTSLFGVIRIRSVRTWSVPSAPRCFDRPPSRRHRTFLRWPTWEPKSTIPRKCRRSRTSASVMSSACSAGRPCLRSRTRPFTSLPKILVWCGGRTSSDGE